MGLLCGCFRGLETTKSCSPTEQGNWKRFDTYEGTCKLFESHEEHKGKRCSGGLGPFRDFEPGLFRI